MRYGLFSTTINDGTVDDVVAEARQAEADGFDTFWAAQIFGNDTLTALAVVAREVPRIELGTSVVPTYPRHPMMLAQQAMTVNATSGGRLCLGIGLSHQIVIESMMGMSFDKPVRHLREYLDVLGPLSRGEPVAFDGETYRVHGAVDVKGSTPFPIVVAALGPQMLKVTAELADGTLTWCTGPQTLQDHTVPTINAAAEAAGRPAPLVIAALPVCVTEDIAGADIRASKIFAIYGQLPSYRAMLDREGAAGAADIAIVGTADEVTERVSALADIGVTDFAAVEFGGNPDEVAATPARPWSPRSRAEPTVEPWPAPNARDRHPSVGRILVVCTANVCRSPVAERLLQRSLDDMLEPGGDEWQVSSAGVSAVRAAPDQRTWKAADAYGIDLRDHRARHLDLRLLRTDGADLVLTMERAHVRHVTTLDRSAWARAFTLKELVRRAALSTPVPDATFGSWLAQIATERSSTDVLSSSPIDDLADPYGRPQAAHDTMVADVARLVAELGRLAPWCLV